MSRQPDRHDTRDQSSDGAVKAEGYGADICTMEDVGPPQIARVARRITRILGAILLAIGVLLLAAAVSFHFSLDAIIRIPFVVISAGAGLMFLFAGLGLLLTGKLSGGGEPTLFW